VTRALALALCSVVAGVLVMLTGSPAAAHASLLSTDPADGAVVQQVPSQIVFTFNEPIRLSTEGVHAFTATGDDWPVTAQAQDNRLVVTPASDPGQGTVVVAWKVISEDGHEVGGSLTFSVGAASAGSASAADATPAPSTSVSIARWIAAAVTVLALLGLFAVVGVVVVGVGLPTGWTHHRLLRGLDALWNVAFVGALLVVPLDELAADGDGLGGLLDWLTWIDGLTAGRSLLLLGAVLVAALLVRVARRTVRPLGRSRTGVLRVAAVALTVVAVTGIATFLLTGPVSDTAPAVASPAERPSSTTKQSAELGTAGIVDLTVHQAPGQMVRLDVRLTDPDGKPLAPYAPPTVAVGDGDIDLGTARLEHRGRGRYRTTVTIPRDGRWQAQVSVRTSEFDNPVAVVPFEVG
jgi:methionine-rich copper-binding protein CopC